MCNNYLSEEKRQFTKCAVIGVNKATKSSAVLFLNEAHIKNVAWPASRQSSLHSHTAFLNQALRQSAARAKERVQHVPEAVSTDTFAPAQTVS